MEDSDKPLSKAASNNEPWLHAWYDPLAGIKTVTGCVRLADLNGDGDSKLCVCDFDKKLKVYKGTNLVVEYALLDVPVAMCIVYTELSSPRVPSVAVAAGSYVFIYRQLRPYRKWRCPPIEISQTESDIWKDIKADKIDDKAVFKLLTEARDSGVVLSSRSTELLSSEQDSTARRSSFINEMKNVEYQQLTLITCMETLKKDSEEPDALTLLVVGTEAGQLLILPQDPNNSVYLCKVELPSVPVLLSVSGMFDIEWRIFITCRDGRMYSIKNGDVRGTVVLVGDSVDLGAQAVAIARQDKLMWVATMDKIVACYTVRGKKTKSICLPEEVTGMCMVPVKRAKVSYLLLVALSTGEIRMFKEGSSVYSFTLEKPIIALRFGPYGREDSSLICIHGNGCLSIKIWRRSADVDSMNPNSGPPPEQDIPLPVRY
jgi:Bardet-Biedl syndrome 1 protein